MPRFASVFGLSWCALALACATDTVVAETGAETQASGEESTGTQGDGDGDPSGDGDGDPSGDGDGEGQPSEPCELIEFSNPSLDFAVRQALSLSEDEPITGEALAQIEQLKLWNAGGEELSGLECATGLIQLELGYTENESLAPIEGLPVLERVVLREVELAEAQASSTLIAELPALVHLTIAGSPDFELDALPLAAGLVELWVSSVGLQDLGPIGELVGLEWLRLHDNEISDLSPLANLESLEVLDLQANQITELDALAGLSELVRLELAANLLSDLSGLDGLPALERLTAANNQLVSLGASNLPELSELVVSSNPLTDISGAAGYPLLGVIDIRDCQVADLSPLSELDNLEILIAEGNEVTQLPAQLSASEVVLVDNQFSSLEPVLAWAEPELWYFNGNLIEDLSPLLEAEWTITEGECPRIYVEDNPLSAPGNAEVAAQLCAGGFSVFATPEISCTAEEC